MLDKKISLSLQNNQKQYSTCKNKSTRTNSYLIHIEVANQESIIARLKEQTVLLVTQNMYTRKIYFKHAVNYFFVHILCTSPNTCLSLTSFSVKSNNTNFTPTCVTATEL